MTDNKKIKVEIWSDVMCPFCYIGKRHFEQALASFEGKDQVEVEWKSFQLDPTVPHDLQYDGDIYQYLAEKKGWSYEQSVQMHQHVVDMAANAGLKYDFSRAKPANSLRAHLLIQLAKSKGLGDEMEEALFKAYFTEGRDFGNVDELMSLGQEIGLEEEDMKAALQSEELVNKVTAEIQEGQQLGLTGVPFFVVDRKYGISGAQPVEAFTQVLEKAQN
jgi:predicted DsbA family dithiol-disulfide isomerase